jgi:hypothetical protein
MCAERTFERQPDSDWTDIVPESIDVISIFENRTLRPAKFRYAGRVHVVEKVLYTWVTREGSFPVHHFSVETADCNPFELALNTYTMEWKLTSAEADAAAG